MTLILETSSGRSILETLREKYEREPRSKLFMPLADQLRVRGEYGEAIELCTHGKVLYPGYVSCRVLLGKCLMELGMREEARRELEEVLELDRENVVSLRVMAEILRAQGRLSEATDYYRAALRINPIDIDAQDRLAVLMRLQESPEGGDLSPSKPCEDTRFDDIERASTETIQLDASELSAEWNSFSRYEAQTEEPVVSERTEPAGLPASQQEPITVEKQESLEDATLDSQAEVESDTDVPSLPSGVSYEETPSSRSPVQFFNYEVKRSDFSRFTEWIRTVNHENSVQDESRGGEGESGESKREELAPDRE